MWLHSLGKHLDFLRVGRFHSGKETTEKSSTMNEDKTPKPDVSSFWMLLFQNIWKAYLSFHNFPVLLKMNIKQGLMQHITQEHYVSKDLWVLRMTSFIVSLFYVKKKKRILRVAKGVWNDLFVKPLTIGLESKPSYIFMKDKGKLQSFL